ARDEPAKSRRARGGPLPARIRDVTLAEIQDPADPILADGIVRDARTQLRDPAVSPVAVAFWEARGRGAAEIYVVPSLDDVFSCVAFSAAYYERGAGASAPRARSRATNAARVRFNIETKLARADEEATFGPEVFVDSIAGRIVRRGLAERASIESFDFRTL